MSVTHRCPNGSTQELEGGRFLTDAGEYRVVCPECNQPVYHNGSITHA